MRQQQNQQQPEYPPGTTVFAKLKGYPWWPARIEADHSVPAKVLKQKSKAKNALYTVFFYGSRDYGFFGPDAIRPFNFDVVENDLKAKKFKTKDLEMAVRQALNPALLAQIEQEEAAEAARQAEEEENNNDENDEEEEEEETEYSEDEEQRGATTSIASTKRKNTNANSKKGRNARAATLRNNSKATSTSTTTTKATKRRSRILEDDEDDNDDNEDGDHHDSDADRASRRRRKTSDSAVDETAVGDNVDRKKRRKSMSLEKDEITSPVGKHHTATGTHNNSGNTTAGGAGTNTENKDEIRKTPEFKKVYQIRHKLQKLVYNKKEGEIPKEDYSKILDVIKEIEEAPMTYNLLKDTKIGKVVKAAICYPFDDENHVIKERCQQLMRNWKTLFIDPQSGLLKPGMDRRKSTTPADEATAATAAASTTASGDAGTPMEED